MTALATGAPISMTGPFGATVVGDQAMRCEVPWFARHFCGLLGLMDDIARPTPQQVVVPNGATVVWAGLTWAATDPAKAGSLDTAAADVDGQQVTLAGSAPAGWQDVPQWLTVRTADVTDLVGGSSRVSLAPLAARRSWQPVLFGQGHQEGSPMAGWSLTVIWSLPGAGTSSVSTNGAVARSSISGDPDRTIVVAPAGTGDITALFSTVWAADPSAKKSLSAGPVVAADIWGIDDQPRATGFDLIAAGDGEPTTASFDGSAGRALTFTNAQGRAIPGFTIFDLEYKDQLWSAPPSPSAVC